MQDDDTPARAEMMRKLPEAERAAAIEEAPNVVGFGRFTQRRHQVALREGYRGPKDGGAA